LEGWVKLHRKILNWQWIDDMNTFRVFLFLLLSANHKDAVWKRHEVKMGQYITSLDMMAQQTKLTRQMVRTAFKNLKNSGEITIKPTNKFSLITIVNWELYQGKGDDVDAPASTQKTHKQHTANTPANTKQEVKNEKNEKKSSCAFAQMGDKPQYDFSDSLSEALETWIAYKNEKRQGYKPSGLKSLMLQVKKNADKYGDVAVIHAMSESMSSNYSGIIWNKAKAFLIENSLSNSDNKAQSGARQGKYANFKQRKWDFDSDDLQKLKWGYLEDSS